MWIMEKGIAAGHLSLFGDIIAVLIEDGRVIGVTAEVHGTPRTVRSTSSAERPSGCSWRASTV